MIGGGRRVRFTGWRIYERATNRNVILRGSMDEQTCRAYVARNPDRYRLVRVEITETEVTI